jgi:hypothetical protein
MEIVSNEVFAVNVPGEPYRVLLRVQRCQESRYGSSVAIRAEPNKGASEEVVALAAIGAIVDLLSKERREHRVLNRNFDAVEGSRDVPDAVIIPGCSEELLRTLLSAVGSSSPVGTVH